MIFSTYGTIIGTNGPVFSLYPVHARALVLSFTNDGGLFLAVGVVVAANHSWSTMALVFLVVVLR